MLDVKEKLRLLLFYPGDFYAKVKNEKGYKTPLLFYATLFIAVSVFGLILDFIARLTTGAFENLFFLVSSLIFTLFLVMIAAFILLFIASAFTHLGLKILRVKCNFQATFKVVTYACVISIFYSMLTHIMDFFFSLSFPQFLNSPEALSQGALVWIFFLLVIIGFLSIVHVIIVEVIGLVKEYNISKVRAFFAVIIVPLILFIVLAIVLFVFFLVMFLMLQSADVGNVSGMIPSAIP